MLHDPSPSYRLSWTPERRKAASDKAKAWWDAKRKREADNRAAITQETERQQMGLIGKIRDKKREQLDRKEHAHAAYFAAEAQANELQAAEDAIVGTLRVLRLHRLTGHVG